MEMSDHLVCFVSQWSREESCFSICSGIMCQLLSFFDVMSPSNNDSVNKSSECKKKKKYNEQKGL